MATHLSLPLRVSPSGRLAANDQDSDRDIAESLALLLSTRPGERRSVPGYGTPDLLFTTNPDLAGIAAAIAKFEDRADPLTLRRTLAAAIAQLDVHATTTRLQDDTTTADVIDDLVLAYVTGDI